MDDILWVLSNFQWYDVVDILLLTALFYFLFTAARGTQAVQLFRGMVVVILGAFLASQVLPFRGFGWLIDRA